MRAIFLNWRDLWHARAGGAEVLAQGLAQRLAAAGNDVVYFSASVPGRPSDEIVDGLRHVRRGGKFDVYRHAYAWLRSSGTPFDVLIDHINTAPFFTPLYERRRAMALVPQLARDVWWYEAPKVLAPLGMGAERIYHRLYRETPAITISRSTENDLRDFGWRGAIRTIAMPINASAVSAYGKNAAPTMLFVGRLTPSKRVEHAITALSVVRAQVPDARLWIIGSGDDAAYVRRLQQQAEDVGNVEFLGRVDSDERQRRMAMAHLLVVTSVREGWGLVVTEANAAGTAALGYDVPGLRDSIKPELGKLVPAGDARALGAIALGMLRDHAALEEMSRRARLDAAQYSWERTYREFVSGLSDLVPGIRIN